MTAGFGDGRDFADRYRSADNAFFRAGKSHFIVYNRSRGSNALISNEAGRVLLECRTFKPLAEHVETCSRLLGPQMPKETLRLMIEYLVDIGMMLGEQSAASRVGELETAANVCRINTVAFPTRNSKMLGGSLVSYICKLRDGVEIIIHDGTEARDAESMLRDVLRTHPVGLRGSMRFASIAHRRRFSRILASEKGIDSSVLDFALGTNTSSPQAYGAARNSILLDTVGEPFFSADDDTVCRISMAPVQHDGVALCVDPQPMDVWFFDSDQSAMLAAREADGKLLELHERVLGRRLTELVGISDQSLDAAQHEPRLFTGLCSGAGRVRLAQMGIAGDSGMAAPAWLELNDSSFHRWTDSLDSYQFGLTKRSVIRAPQRYLVGSSGFFMSTAASYDNRKILPPFSPSYRNEDGLFSICLGSLDSLSFIGYVPFCISHVPHSSRQFDANCLDVQHSRCRVNDLLCLIVSGACLGGSTQDPEGYMRNLGSYLEGMADLGPSSFHELLRQTAWQVLGEFLRRVEERYLVRPNLPGYFMEGFDRYRKSLRRALLAPEYVIPREMGNVPGGGLQNLQSYVRQFGQLVGCWPEIIRGARDLRLDGVRVSSPVEY